MTELGQCGWVDVPATGEGVCPEDATVKRERDGWQVVFCDDHAARHDAGERPDRP